MRGCNGVLQMFSFTLFMQMKSVCLEYELPPTASALNSIKGSCQFQTNYLFMPLFALVWTALVNIFRGGKAFSVLGNVLTKENPCSRIQASWFQSCRLLFEIHQNIFVVHILNKGNIMYIVCFLKNTVICHLAEF